LRKYKLLWYKAGNEISERQWNDVVSVIKVQKDHLDWDYLFSWAERLKIKGLLRKALEVAER